MLLELNSRINNIAKSTKSNLTFFGIIGLILFPAYHYILKYIIPQDYETWPLRLVAMAFLTPLLFYNKLSKNLKKYFPWYFIFTLLYCIPFYCSFMLIKNNFSQIWVLTDLFALLLLNLLVYDWVIFIAMLVIGFFLACLAALIIDGAILFSEFKIEYGITYFAFIICGSAINYKNKTADIALSTLLKDLSASVAHEMRGPLGSINQSISLIDDILKQVQTRSTTSHNDEILTIYNNEIKEVNSLLGMIDGSIVRGNLTIDMILKNIQEKKIDGSGFKILMMSDVIKVALREYVFVNGEKEKVFVNFNNDFTFKGDENLMVFTLFNLIKNSLYYMKVQEEGRIDLWMENKNGTNSLHFKDNGPGISKERLPKMFESYMTKDKKGGTGLGLPFCHRAMASFDGNIECFSEFGKWTEFVMAFPECKEKIDNSIGHAEITEDEIIKLASGKTILLVDDENLIRMVMKARLKHINIKIIEAEQGKQAIELLEQNSADLVFMDVQMPEINGFDTTKRIRLGKDFKNFQNYKSIPIIALTGNTSDKNITLIQSSGMNDYMDKSMTKEQLFEILKKWLR